MLGLLLIYFIGEKFYQLAASFEKSKWGYAILGVVSYYIGTFIFGVVLFLVLDATGGNPEEDLDSTAMNVIAVPFGLLSCYILYIILKKNWEKNRIEDTDVLDDMDMSDGI
ncbi:MAG: hypothetical protein JNM22_11565 [Saprospiraceae bacterium]|nr:hypothetical protein [Saprospiraceae bacterium]